MKLLKIHVAGNNLVRKVQEGFSRDVMVPESNGCAPHALQLDVSTGRLSENKLIGRERDILTSFPRKFRRIEPLFTSTDEKI